MNLKIKIIPVILLLLIGFTSCNQKDVKLPVIGVHGIQDTIYNNSAIWIFYNVKGNDTIAELNRKNKITNTHWIFNIDRRLALKYVIPHIKKMQEKKEAPSPHDNGEISHLYYSYVDTISHKLSMLQFDSIHYFTNEKLNLDTTYHKHLILKYTKTKLLVNDTSIPIQELDTYIQSKLDSIPLKVYLNLDKNISYGQYIHLKAILDLIKNDSIVLNNEEFIN